MREFILAMHAIWDCWNKSEKLNFRGDFYQHTLMTSMFVPGKVQQGAPRVHLAAVGPKMTEVAAEVADGIIAHGFTTQKYLAEITMPVPELMAGRYSSLIDSWQCTFECDDRQRQRALIAALQQ